jgi:predicted permease
MAIGAHRLQIVRLLMTESLLLALLGGVFGLLLGIWGANALVKVAGSGLLSFHLLLGLDSRVLGVTTALCLITGLLSGLAPAVRASSLSLSPVLSERDRDTGISGRKFGFGKAMIISQVSLSVLLLIGAGLFIRTLRNLKSQNLGFNEDHVLLIWTAPDQGGRRGASVASLFQMTRERLSSIPGVISASPSTHGLLGSNYGPGPVVVVPGNTYECSGEATAAWNVIAPGFFDTVGMQLVRGRDFTEQDNESAPQVAIINETMARCFFKDEDPIGKRFGKGRDLGYPWEIVGVVKDAKDNALRDTNRRLFYVPYHQDVSHLDAMCVAVRTADNRSGLVARISQELAAIDPNVPVLRISSIEEQMNESLVQERLIAQISAFFAAIAVLLACAGLCGVISYTTARKTREIGIRISLGSTPSDVVAVILKENLAMVLAGITIGLIVALVFGRLISASLFGISPTDSFTFVSAALLMIAVATLAAFLPARRASRIDPMVALRYE